MVEMLISSLPAAGNQGLGEDFLCYSIVKGHKDKGDYFLLLILLRYLQRKKVVFPFQMTLYASATNSKRGSLRSVTVDCYLLGRAPLDT